MAQTIPIKSKSQSYLQENPHLLTAKVWERVFQTKGAEGISRVASLAKAKGGRIR